MVNDFVGLFIIFLPRVVLFRVATLHIALRDRRPKGRERGKMSAQSAGGSWYLLTPVLIFTFVPPFYGLPHRLLCIMLLLPQNMFLGVSSVVTMTTRCRKGWWLLVWWTNEQKHSVAVIYVSIFCVTLSIHPGNFYGLEIWHKIFWGLNFGPEIFFGFCLKP